MLCIYPNVEGLTYNKFFLLKLIYNLSIKNDVKAENKNEQNYKYYSNFNN